MKTYLTETYLKAARIHLVILHCSLGKPLRICFPILRVYHSLIMIVRNVFISINKRMSKHSHILFSILHQSLHFTCIKLPSSSGECQPMWQVFNINIFQNYLSLCDPVRVGQSCTHVLSWGHGTCHNVEISDNVLLPASAMFRII